jgi:hypothetical protein
VAPLRLGGLRGKQSTPSDWLGGTGEVATVGKQERQGARDINRGADNIRGRHKETGTLVYFIEYNALDIRLGIVRCCISCVVHF